MGNKQHKTKKPSLVDALLKKKKAKRILKVRVGLSKMLTFFFLLVPYFSLQVLLLGSGESGKTTLIKQLRLIHKHSFNSTETQEFKTAIYQNLVNNIKVLIEAAAEYDIEYADAQNIEKLKQIIEKNETAAANSYYNEDLAALVKSAWNDTAIQKVWNEHYSTLHLPDSAK